MTRKNKRVVRLPAVVPGDVRELLGMLTHKRPSGGAGEGAFIARYIDPVGALSDPYGNRWLTVGAGSPVLWSCHTDTVHRSEGVQKVLYGLGTASVEGGECLGADDGAGVWLMLEMIRAGVPGTYVFHRDEEIGGGGSEYIASMPEWLEGVRFAIAFDRKGCSDIITHQGGRRCASDAFASSLAECLRPLAYRASDGGSFTDTANYVSIVPECTNIAVGYHKQHTGHEWLDVGHLVALRDVLITADFSGLVCERDPLARDTEKPWYIRGWESDLAWPDGRDVDRVRSDDARADDEMTDYVRRHAADVAEFLIANGYRADDIDDYIFYGK